MVEVRSVRRVRDLMAKSLLVIVAGDIDELQTPRIDETDTVWDRDDHLAESKGVELDADRAVEPEAQSLSDVLAVNPAPRVIYVHWFPSCHFMI